MRYFHAWLPQVRGDNVLEAPNGVKGLKLARECPQGKIHLFLTDVIMSLIGGKEMSEKLQLLHPDSRLIFTSGYTDEAMVRHGVLDPGINFIQKPYSLTTLSRRDREVLDGSAVNLSMD